MTRTVGAPASAGNLVTMDPAQTRSLGAALGRAAQPGSVLALIGPLGAGKTQLTKGVAEGLGVRSVVNSPTFVLMNEHAGRIRLFHVDAYRLEDPEEALAAGLLDERGTEGVRVIEWADRLDGWLPSERLDLWLALDPDDAQRRMISWQAYGHAHATLASIALGPPGEGPGQ